MQYRFFSIPVQHGADSAAELNHFLSTHRVVSVERHLIADGANSVWAVCVVFDENAGTAAPRVSAAKRGKIDYREVLAEPDFAVFARLRAWRKDVATAEGVAPYVVFTNDQLAEIVRRRATSVSALREIDGVGEARAEKYGAGVLKLIKDAALPAVAPPSGDDGAGDET